MWLPVQWTLLMGICAVATRLVSCLERLLGMGDSACATHDSNCEDFSDALPDDQTDLLILSALTLLQGILLLHPPSRSIFAREIYMNVRPTSSIAPTLTDTRHLQLLLDLLDIQSCPSIPSTTLLVLVTALLATPANTRTFERIDGPLAVTSLFKSRSTPRDVKLKVVEFLYFYLMPETPAPSSAHGSINAGTPATAAGQGQLRSPSKLLGALGERRSDSLHGAEGGGGAGGAGEDRITRTMEEKQKLLGRHLNDVEDLVQDLRDNAPFVEMVC